MDEMFPPELLQALAQSGLLPQIMELAQGQMTRGQAMSDTPMPKGQVYEPGYQAPHPLEYVSAILRRGQGDKITQGAQAQAQGAMGQYGQTAQDYYKALAAAMRQPQTQAPQQPMAPTGEALFGPGF